MVGNKAPRRGGMARNFAWLGLGQVMTTVLTVALSAILARELGPADFGLLYLATAIATFAYVVVDWGHGSYIIREVAIHPQRTGNLMGSALALRGLCALLACGVTAAVVWLLGYDARTRLLAAVMILGLLPQYLGLSFGWVFRAHERMDSDALLNVVCKLVTLVGSVICLALGGRLLGLVGASALAGMATLVTAIVVYRRLHLPAISATPATARELLRGGVALFAMTVTVAVEPYLCSNILYRMSSSSVVGWYGAAMNIAGTLIAPATVLGATMFPRFSRAATDAVEFKRAFDTSFKPLLLVAVLGGVGTYLCADAPVGLIYGLQKFGPAAETLRAFAPVLPLMYVDLYLSTALTAAGRAGRLARAKGVAVLLTTALTFILVPVCQEHFANGGLGVMYAIAIGELLMLVACVAYMREVFDRRAVSDVLRTLAAGAGTILLIRMLPRFSPWLIIPACVLVFGALALVFGAVKRSDSAMLLAAFRRT